MKKVMTVLTCFLLLCALSACGDSGYVGNAVESTEQKTESRESAHETVETSAETVETKEIQHESIYVRTDGYNEEAKYPFYSVIKSEAELSAYYEKYKDMYNLEHKEKIYSDTTIGFLDACDGFDGEFFSEKALVIAVLEEPSGSIRHRVAGVRKTGSDLSIEIERHISAEQTDDMTVWHIIVAVDKDELKEDRVILNIVSVDTVYIDTYEAVKLAKEVVNVEYDEIEVTYIAEDHRYMVYFKSEDTVGGYRTVYVSVSGEVLDVMWDA